MTDQLISLETDKLAKEKGCTLENCHCGGYPDCICTDKRITQSLLQKWLREVCNLNPYVRKTKDNFWKCFLETTTENSTNTWWSKDKKTYEEALEPGLQEALKLIK